MEDNSVLQLSDVLIGKDGMRLTHSVYRKPINLNEVIPFNVSLTFSCHITACNSFISCAFFGPLRYSAS